MKEIKRIDLRKGAIPMILAGVIGISGIGLTKKVEAKGNIKVDGLSQEDRIDTTQFYDEAEIYIDDSDEVEELVHYDTLDEDAKEEHIEVESIVEEESPKTDDFYKGDSVISKGVNLRFSPDVKSFKLGYLPEGAVADRILSTDNWDLVKYDGKLGYAFSNYIVSSSTDYNNDYYYVEDYSDIVRISADSVNFRIGPSKEEKKICVLAKDEELEVVGKAYFTSTQDCWYLAKIGGHIGFVKASYTKSLREDIETFIQRFVQNLKTLKLEK